MPVDPNISLQGTPVAPAGATSPLQLVEGLATLQNRVNENTLFQQTFHANQEIGKIFATAPDFESAIEQASKSPYAPWASAALNNFRTMQNTNAQMQKTYADLAGSSLQGFVKGALPAIAASGDLSAWDNLASSALSTVPAGPARKLISDGMASAKTAYLGGLPTGQDGRLTPEGASLLQRRAFGGMLGLGLSPEAAQAPFGTPFRQDLGSGVAVGTTAPVTGVPTVNTVLPRGVAPEYKAGPGGVNQLAPGVGPGQPSGLPSTENPLAAPTTAAATASVPATANPAAPAPLAGDGKPLIPPGLPPAPSVGTGVGGLKVLSQPQQEAAKGLVDYYNNEGKKSFENANATMSSLAYMDNAYDRLAAGGGFLVPGTAAEARVGLSKFANTVSQIIGKDVPMDAEKIASAEDFVKETKRMGVMVTNALLGQQREAAQTIMNLTASVPGITNSYLGGKLITEGIRAATQRVLDQRNFENSWMQDPRNQGNLTGATEAFNALHPAQDYAAGVMQKFGLDKAGQGFASPEAVRTQVQQGYLSREQGLAVLHRQWPNGPAPAAAGAPGSAEPAYLGTGDLR